MSTTNVTKPARTPQPQTRSPKLGERRTPQHINARSATKQDDSLDSNSATEMISKDEYLRTIDRLEAQAKAINANSIARAFNSHVTRADDDLMPLVSLKAGTPFERFPACGREVNKLSLSQINELLVGLGAEKTGSEMARRERLRVQIGLKDCPA